MSDGFTMLTQTLNSFSLLAPGMAQAMTVPTRSLGSPIWDTAGAVPSLDLNLAQNKSLLDSVTGQSLVTFTRASNGTYVGADGLLKTATTNEARFDHNPTTGESLGLLVEEQRTNLLLRSEEIGTSPWGTNLGGSVTYTANAAASPAGTVTADRVTATADFAGPNQFASVTSGLSYTFSFYIKAVSAGSKDQVRIEFFGSFAQFRISTLAFSNVNAAITATSAQAVGDGWVRVALTRLAPSTGALASAVYADTDADFYLWGAQLEAGAFPTSYIPTTTATVTRSADVASITGANFSSWYRQDEGTVFAEGSILNTGANRFIAATNDGTTNEEIGLYWSSTFGSLVTDNGVVQGNSFGGSVTANSRTLQAFGYKINDMRGYGNGTALSAITSATVPTTNRVNIGRRDDSSFWLNGTIRRLTYWPTRLSNATLQAITA